MSLSAEIASTVQQALAGFSSEFRYRHRVRILSLCHESGGYPGRAGYADLYYTRFALNALTGLDADKGELRSSLPFMASCAEQNLNLIDAFCLLDAMRLLQRAGLLSDQSEWAPSVRQQARREALAVLRPAATQGVTPFPDSLYMIFLACLIWENLELSDPMDDVSEALGNFILEHQRNDGGFSDTLDQPWGQTNPTAAAVGVLTYLRRMDDAMAERVARFLSTMQRSEGGLAANAQAPTADLLSTFTGLTALWSLQRIQNLSLPPVAVFLKTLAADGGGFHGWPGDERIDTEYTYYGLGVAALLADVRLKATR